jgi:hypothetical protein
MAVMTRDEEAQGLRRSIRRNMLRLMLSVTFAGGVLFGLLIGAVEMPGVWVAPVVLLAAGAFWVFVR